MRLILASLASTFFFYVAGCTSPAQPCDTSMDCGSGQVCSSQRCQALSCNQTFSAVDPADGQCKPISGCSADPSTRTWKSCDDPCTALGEFACIADPRCQPIYTTTGDATPTPCALGGAPSAAGDVGGCGSAPPRTFNGCRSNPIVVDPCSGLDQTACAANPQCVVESIGVGCDCPPGAQCNCPAGPSFECRLKSCTDFTDGECSQHPECQLGGPVPCDCPAGASCACGGPAPLPSPPAFVDGGVPSSGIDAGVGGSCFPRFTGCYGMDETTCLQHGECHPVGTPCYCPPGASCSCSGGNFVSCEPDDGMQRCNADSDCGGDQRCSTDTPADDVCAPPVGQGGVATPTGGVGFATAMTTSGGAASPQLSPPSTVSSCVGLCVPKGCKGDGEASCNADPSCEPVYQLECSPYGGGIEGGGGVPCAQPPSNAGAGGGAGVVCGNSCEPTFVGCVDAPKGTVVDPEKSVLLRDPTIVDDPAFSFPQVMAKLAGTQDPNAFVTAWLSQLGQAITVDGKTAAARQPAADYLAGLPHRPDGTLDIAQLGFQTTSLSNRIDLAGPGNCGEARLTFALQSGVTDRRHRMTVIVELKQPDDGARCATTAQKWLALSSLSGSSLLAAVKQIYAPLLSAANVDQVRTNEFLVGDAPAADASMAPAWELREWRLGTDGQLHLAPSKQALDPSLAMDAGFASWLQQNRAQVLAGTATLPDAYLAVTSSENGQRIQTADPDATDALNQQACAGCHTTETNTAFVQVGERFGGTGRAQISQFMAKQLQLRSNNLFTVSLGLLTEATRALPKPVH